MIVVELLDDLGGEVVEVLVGAFGVEPHDPLRGGDLDLVDKRANGEGTVRQRPNGLWEGRVSYVDPVTDQRKSASVYGATAADCRRELKKGTGAR